MRVVLASYLLTLASVTAAFADIKSQYRPEADQAVVAWLDDNVPDLLNVYKELHAHPELSLQEQQTGVRLAEELRRAGCEVTPNVGGHGVVGLLRNGPGPTILIRTDMDALPVREETGLPYASTCTTTGPDGEPVPVMHACGHDMHMTTIIGTARALAALRDRWSGTVMFIGQPAEEVGRGARAMIADGLFERFGKPDYCLGLHVKDDLPVGTVGCVSGWAFANVDSVDIVVHGRGGHGARPQQTADPIVAAAHLVTALQTLVSRRLPPTQPGVVTVGSIHGGSTHNVIPDEVTLQLTVRSYTDEARTQLLDGIRQLATDICEAFGCPTPPTVTVRDEHTPASYNDPELAGAAIDVFKQVFGAESVIDLKPEMVGEDFGVYARHLGVPGIQFRVGAVSREAYEVSLRPGSSPLPPLHSAHFAPVPEPTLRTSIRAMTNLAVSLLAAR